MSIGVPPTADDFVQQCRDWLGELLTLVMELALECHPYEKSAGFRKYAAQIARQMPNYQVDGVGNNHHYRNLVLDLDELTTLLDNYVGTLDRVCQTPNDTGEASEAYLQTMRSGRRLHLQMSSHLRNLPS